MARIWTVVGEMSWYQHHVIVATFYNYMRKDAARVFEEVGEEMRKRFEALDLEPPGLVSFRAPMNGYTTIMLAPDCSKEGHPESDAGDAVRDFFIQKLGEFRDEDGQPVKWIEVQYGEDMEGHAPSVTRHYGEAWEMVATEDRGLAHLADELEAQDLAAEWVDAVRPTAKEVW